MKAIILAAGIGTRLGSLTESRPKPLVNVGGKPLLDHTLDTLEQLGVEQVVVVGGYMIDRLRGHLKNGRSKIVLLENRRFREGNLLSLMAALDHLVGDILVMNADHIYPVELMKRFTGPGPAEVRIACDFDRVLGSDDMKVLLDPEHRLVRIGKGLTEYNGGYIGMTFVPASRIEDYRQAILTTHTKKKGSALVEEVLGHLADTGRSPVAIDLSGFGWLEIDSLEDLSRAEECLAEGDWKEFWIKR